jgi:hypothetical protein
MSPVADEANCSGLNEVGHASHDVFRIAGNGSRCLLEKQRREAQNTATRKVTDLFTVTLKRKLLNHRKRLI